eukprot:2491344-Alexandrium_andersonii.AAC.1
MGDLHESWRAEFSGLRDTMRVQINRAEDITNVLSRLTQAVQELQAQASNPVGRSACADAPAPGGVPNPSFGHSHDYGSWRNSWW